MIWDSESLDLLRQPVFLEDREGNSTPAGLVSD